MTILSSIISDNETTLVTQLNKTTVTVHPSSWLEILFLTKKTWDFSVKLNNGWNLCAICFSNEQPRLRYSQLQLILAQLSPSLSTLRWLKMLNLTQHEQDLGSQCQINFDSNLDLVNLLSTLKLLLPSKSSHHIQPMEFPIISFSWWSDYTFYRDFSGTASQPLMCFSHNIPVRIIRFCQKSTMKIFQTENTTTRTLLVK